MLAALVILVVTYALLTMRRLPGTKLRHRPLVALLGGLAMMAAGELALPDALRAVNLDILALLFGMLSMAACLEVCGFFDWLSWRVVELATGQRALLAGTMLVTAVLSALILNDAVVLIFTPVLVKACRLLRVDAMPYLAGEALAANIGSVATEVGNPQNAFIAIQSGIPFGAYALALVPVAAACLLLGIGLLFLLFRRALAQPLAKRDLELLPPKGHTQPALLRAALLVLLGVLLGFVLGPRFGLSIAHVALAGGLAVMVATLVLLPRELPHLARGVDWTILVFFVGLFWLIAGFRAQGWSDQLAAPFLGGAAPSVTTLTAWSAALSNVVSNVPAVLLISPTLEPLHDTRLWLALAASSTLAGNATLVGAAANVIVAETARAHGAEFDVKRFMLAGVPVTLATLALMLLMLR
ncbi:MAG: hypothetical protein LC624_10315 [Halobacteriales archaeon]|nr:hypothetical protein [Halobacteriales archaeon]